MAAALRWVLQLHRDVPRAAQFYSEGLNFSVNVCTLRWAELQSGPLKLALMHTNDSMEVFERDAVESPNVAVYYPLFDEMRFVQYMNHNHCLMIHTYFFSNLSSQRLYSSMLSFTVPDINSTVSKLMALGAELDGPIKYEIHGKVAALRCIDGHMLGLYEPV
ncbi:hypothetical protein U9M48_009723 [Paspalum notatum var. saurae]|uniref:VOC domain-containing protein n=1 Tax=Paspalum notatum var. saurae TaxID=547442 RepID=A0AAQ3WFG1_PASNO